jgi:hypothetical protein
VLPIAAAVIDWLSERSDAFHQGIVIGTMMPCSRETHKPATATIKAGAAASTAARPGGASKSAGPVSFSLAATGSLIVDISIVLRPCLHDVAGLGMRATTGMTRVVMRWYSAYCGYRWA